MGCAPSSSECAYYGVQGGLMALLGLMISAYWPNRYVFLASLILYLILFTVSSVILIHYIR